MIAKVFETGTKPTIFTSWSPDGSFMVQKEL